MLKPVKAQPIPPVRWAPQLARERIPPELRDHMLSTHELAKMLGVSPICVLKFYLKHPYFPRPAIREGRFHFWDRREVASWLDWRRSAVFDALMEGRRLPERGYISHLHGGVREDG